MHWARHLLRTRDLQKRDRRLHRVRAAAVRAHGRADLPQARRPPRPDLARVGAHARRRPGSPTTGCIDNIQASWVKLGQDGARQLLAGRRQRPRRHPDGREHQPRRRRRPRPAGHARRAPRRSPPAPAGSPSSAPPSTGPSPSAPDTHPEARGRMTPQDRLQGLGRAVRTARPRRLRRARRAGRPRQRDGLRPPPAVAAHRRPRPGVGPRDHRHRRAHRAGRARHERADPVVPLQPGRPGPDVRHPRPAVPRPHRPRRRHRRGAQRGGRRAARSGRTSRSASPGSARPSA